MKKLIFILLSLVISISLFAQEVQDGVQKKWIYDEANLLTESNIAELQKRAQEISNIYNFDLVIVIKTSLEDGVKPTTFADDFFDNNGYGFGEEGDGCLFLLVTNSVPSSYGVSGGRDYVFSTSGRAIKLYNQYALDTLEKRVLSLIKNGNMVGASREFFNISEEIFKLNEKGRGYNFFHVYHIHSIIFVWLFSIAVGIYCLVYWIKLMNTLIPVKEADNYMTSAGLAVSAKKDRFLFSTVSKTVRVDKSSLAQGAARMASSGRVKGGRSGRF